MKRPIWFLLPLLIVLLTSFQLPEDRFITYNADPHRQQLAFYWKNEQGALYRSIGNLRTQLAARQRKLVFAMNGGMYMENKAPLGLFIENGKTLAPLNRSANSTGNFYMQPNGVFYITAGHTPVICRTADFKPAARVQYATQSGPMLVIDGRINPLFKQGSANLNIRNGVGILPGGKAVFVMSKEGVNFYDFAAYFKQLGCSNALYLDGFVSRTYLPARHWEQTDGDFGVIIAVTE
jgi:uncharacterized protein YigE (DUF2233 family)